MINLNNLISKKNIKKKLVRLKWNTNKNFLIQNDNCKIFSTNLVSKN